MREFVRAGEVAAVLGMDPKLSPWAIWNRMSEGLEDGMTEGSRWQGRLASEIAVGIAKDHGLKITKALEPEIQHGIMPPRAWEVAPSIKTNGHPAVLMVMQRTQQAMYGWTAPSVIPATANRALMRFVSTAIAYGYDYIHVGILIDGYRSEVYQVQVDPETRGQIITKVAEMIEMVREDDEPVVDYEVDKEAVRDGKVLLKTELAGPEIDALLAEREERKAFVRGLRNQVDEHNNRIDAIETLLIATVKEGSKIDTGNHIVEVERNSKNKLVIKVGTKAKAANLF